MVETELPSLDPEVKKHLSRFLIAIIAIALINVVTQNNDHIPKGTQTPVFYRATPQSQPTVTFVDSVLPEPLIKIDQPLPNGNANTTMNTIILTVQERIVRNTLRSRSSQPDLAYQGQYYRQAELDLSPTMLTTRANIWMAGEYSATSTQGCFGDPVDGSQYQIATWLYPCGTIVEIKNPQTDQSVFAEVTDRGPNRNYRGPGYENDRIREFGIDVTAAVARAIDHTSGNVVVVRPIQTNLPPRNIFVDLTNSPGYYTGIDPSSGDFIAWKQ